MLRGLQPFHRCFFFFKQIERVTIARRIMVSECKSACFEAGEEESIFRLLNWDE